MGITMDFYLAEKTDKSVTIKFRDSNTTLINPIMEELDKDKNVKTVRFINSHPELEEPALYVETSKGNPLDAISKAAEKVSQYYATIKK